MEILCIGTYYLFKVVFKMNSMMIVYKICTTAVE